MTVPRRAARPAGFLAAGVGALHFLFYNRTVSVL